MITCLRYTKKRIAELQQQIVRGRWEVVELEGILDELRKKQP